VPGGVKRSQSPARIAIEFDQLLVFDEPVDLDRVFDPVCR